MKSDFPSDTRHALTERIVKGLPPEARADYYREFMYLRSLPENDEMLRIIRVMQLLTLLMDQVPTRVTVEREKLEQALAAALKTIQKTREAFESYQAQLDRRLTQLPEKVATEINPEAIAAKINESLRQQFVQSTIPQTAQALQTAASEMKTVAATFISAAKRLGDSHQDAAEKARQASSDMVRTSSQAIETIRLEAAHLSRRYQWPLYALAGLALGMMFVLGTRFQRWLDSTTQPAAIAPVIQPGPPVVHPNVRPKTRPRE